MSVRHVALLILAVGAGVALIVIGIFWPHYAAGGWLTAFVYVSAVPLGSLELMFIYRLTGGAWGDALRPFYEPAAACIPLLALLFVPVLIALPTLFPWVDHAAAIKELRPGVAAYYLNTGSFIGRAIFGFVFWSALALILPRVGGKPGTLIAGVGFVVYAVIMTLLSIDWILSAEPAFVSTSFGASICIMQLLAALAFAAVAAPIDDEQAVRDLGGLMLAVVLGLTYIDFMAVLVMWYGDVPSKIVWFLERTFGPWKWLAVIAFAFTSPGPVLALLLERVRGSRSMLRGVGGSILFGLAFYVAYLLAPAYGPWALGTAALAALALGSALILFVGLGAAAALLPRPEAGSTHAEPAAQGTSHE